MIGILITSKSVTILILIHLENISISPVHFVSRVFVLSNNLFMNYFYSLDKRLIWVLYTRNKNVMIIIHESKFNLFKHN